MPRETITLALSSLWPFEASAQFFGILIEPTDAEARRQLTLAEYHRQLRHDAETDPEGARIWQYWPPEYLLFDPALAEKLHKRAMDILDRERMIAAERARSALRLAGKRRWREGTCAMGERREAQTVQFRGFRPLAPAPTAHPCQPSR